MSEHYGLYTFAVCCFRSEVVGVLIDMVMPGMVTEFHDMGGLGKPPLSSCV